MSADSWRVCPRCRQKELDRLGELSERVSAGYGVLPIEEFDALRSELAKGIDERKIQTFREDYEFYGAESGEVKYSYSGHCQVCGLGVDFDGVRTFYPPPNQTDSLRSVAQSEGTSNVPGASMETQQSGGSVRDAQEVD